MAKFLADVWNGKTFGLAKHYWLFLVLPSAVFTVLAKVLEFSSLSFTPQSYGWVSGLLWTITVIVFGIGYVGLINCARIRRFRGWSAIAVVVTTLSLIGGIGRIIAQFSGTSFNDTEQFYDAANSINAQTPKKIDIITTLTKAEYKNNVFTYFYHIDPTVSHSTNWSADRIREAVKKNACDTFKGSFGTSALQSVRYVYNTNGSDKIVIEIGESDCNPYSDPSR
jgi:hypothetical protein